MASDLRTTLKSLLRSSTGDNIQACLIKSLTKASPEQVKELSTLLAPLSSQAGVRKHCVRCHEEYRENENHKTACTIEHDEDGYCERTEVGSDELTETLSCCGIEFNPEEGPPDGFCILDFHTTDPDKVVYYDDDERDYDDGVNENVVTCAKAGCLKKRKQGKEGADSRASKKRK